MRKIAQSNCWSQWDGSVIKGHGILATVFMPDEFLLITMALSFDDCINCSGIDVR